MYFCVSLFAAGISRDPSGKYNEAYMLMFTWTMAQLKLMLPLPDNPLVEGEQGVFYLSLCYQRGSQDEQAFIHHLALFLCTFLKEHISLVEADVSLCV